MMDTSRLRKKAEAIKGLGEVVLSMRIGGDSMLVTADLMLRAAECIEGQNEIIRSLGGNYESAPTNPSEIASTECPLCGVGSPHEHTPQEQVIFSNGLKKGRAENLAISDKELSETQLYNAYYLGFSMVDYSCGNAAQHTSGLRAVIKAYKDRDVK